MGKPLEGIKVIEVSQWAFVPACGGILSDMGAEVIKVEPPTGDALRGLSIGAIGNTSRVDLSWESYNRGKKSVTLDLKQPEGRDILMKLLAGADVYLTNMRPPAREAMGLDVDTIRAKFPKLIYASGSGTGPNGPDKDKGGYDAITFWARGGISATMTEDGADHPVGPPGPAFGDTLSGSMLAGAICAAIANRAHSGESSHVDVSLLGAAIWAMGRFTAQSTMDGNLRFPRPHKPKPFNVLVTPYRTSDNRFVSLCMLQADKLWPGFCRAVGKSEWIDDPRYVDSAARRDNTDACYADMQALFASKTLAEWREILSTQAGPWDVVQEVGELHKDVQVVANNYVQTVDYGDGTTIPLVAVPWLFDGKAMPARRSPDLGADSDEVLADVGLSEDEIIDLKIKGVVF
jgi:crotonobetainyl-CoA:carnitine CoA-transferase CaiB-like acyl-CoA transferase